MRGSAALRTGATPGGALAGPWVQNPLWARARAVPSLDLRFADNKSLTDSATGSNLVTFTRASSGTFVGSDGVLRTAVTNLLLRSEEFDNAYWAKSESSVSANAVAAPNGTTTADSFLESATTGFHNINTAPTMLASTAYVFSIYAKANGRDWLVMNIFTGAASPRTWFNVSTGIVGTVGAGAVASISAAGDGWYRCSIAVTTAATGGPNLAIWTATADNNFFHAGDITKGLYIWGAQLEQSATVGEYIPTTSTINSAPRFDHNPTTGESLGLLVEEQRTNLTAYSEDATQWGAGSNMGTTLSNQTTAPDGTNTADKIVENTANSTHFLSQSQTTSYTGGVAYTRSIFVKAAGRSLAAVYFPSTNFPTPGRTATFDLSTGVVINSDSGVTARIEPYPNGWFRLSITATATITSTGHVGGIQPSDNTGFSAYIGDGTSGLFVWGAQLEAGAFPTSYIPTTTAAATRSADVASITGSAFSGWYSQSEGTVFADANSPTGGTHFTCDDGTVNTNRVVLYYNTATDPRLFIASAGATSCNIAAGAITSNNRALMVGTYKLNDFAATVNGLTPTLDALGNTPTGVDRARIGRSSGDGGYLNGCLRRLTYWPTRLANSTLQTLTQ